MPFPLAHPAAVLPLRRWCPQYLSLVSLIIGSLVPDLTNCLDWDNFTHSLVGSVAFCWPFGMISLWAFQRVHAPLVATLPPPHREALVTLCGERRNSFFVCAISMLLGIWLHLGWDSFTHEHGWLAHRLGSLSVSLPNQGTVQMGVSRLLWVLSTVGGTALVAAAYLSWLKRAKSPASLPLSTEWRGYATWFVLLLIPAVAGTPLTLLLYLDHLNFGFLIRAFVEFYFALLYLTLVIAGFVLLGRGRKR